MKKNFKVVALFLLLVASLSSCNESDLDSLRVDKINTDIKLDDPTTGGSSGGSNNCPDCTGSN